MTHLTRFGPAVALAAALALAGCATPPAAGPGAGAQPAEPASAGQKEPAQPAAGDQAAKPERLPEDTARAAAEEPVPPKMEAPEGLSRDNLYRLLVADLAGRQGNLELALEGYLETARDTRDPRVAERATRIAVYAGDDRAALEAGQRWVELAPDSRDAHSLMARLRLEQGDADRALVHLRRVVALTEGGADAGMHEVAALVGGTGKPKVALDAMTSLAREHPDLAVSHYAVGELANAAGESQRALDSVQRALKIDPGYTQARLLRARILIAMDKADAAFAGLRKARAQSPDDRALALGYLRLMVQEGRADQATREMQKVFEHFGDDSLAVYSLALMAMQAEAWDDAQIYLERLVAMDQRTSVAHYYLGRIAQQEGDCTKALRQYIKVGRGEHRFDAELRAAGCMADLGRMDEARLHLDRMNARYDTPDARTSIALTRARIERSAGNDDRALKVLGDAIESDPDNVDLLYAHALAASDMDQFELARDDLGKILDQEPDNAQALNALGYMLANRNLDLARARSMIERALKQNPEDGATLDSMGWVLYRQGRLQQALGYLRRAYDADPGAEIGAHLGEVLWALGRQDEARSIWNEAREQEPDNAILNETVRRLTR